PITRMTEIELAYDDSVIGFEFRAMDFTAPSKNQFSYMLAGFDQAWVNVKGMRQVTYTNLDAGEYTFKVKGSNNDGVWNPTPTLLKLTVLPPIWATWLAYAVFLVLVLGGLYQLQVANARRLRREAELRYSARLQLYIESLDLASDCVLIADADKKLMYANHATARILGVAPEDAVGKSISKLLFTDPGDVRNSTEGLRSEGRWHGEVNSRSGLLVVTTDVTIAAVRDTRDNVTAYVCIARDVTQRKRTESELADHRRNLEVLVADRTQALEREIAETMLVQRELANSLREKELLLKELHHRVKNNMQVMSSLLSIQAESAGNEQLAELLGESQQRIKSMALIHENLYQSKDLLEIDFDDYITMLAGGLRHLYEVPGVVVSLDIRVTNVSLDIDSAVPCGLIINELISNSLKHGFVGRQGEGTIFVEFSQVEGRYVLHIRDDGIGLPAGFDVDAALTMGMEIVSILTQQLDGEITFENNGGARFEVSFPQKVKHDV
ncbi:MAG: PAS domain S-box protein, partial [SAR86 cluster bacterium]|nr:PAS domain S-box protein [SAR86 cluster bacterium]